MGPADRRAAGSAQGRAELRNRQMSQAMSNSESGEDLPATWRQKMEEEQRRADAEVTALLGAQKAKEWQEYQRTTGARTVARQLRNMLEGSGQPLEESQMPAVVRALADAEQNGEDIRAANPIAARGGPRDSAERIAMLEKQIETDTRQHARLHDAVASVSLSRTALSLRRDEPHEPRAPAQSATRLARDAGRRTARRAEALMLVRGPAGCWLPDRR